MNNVQSYARILAICILVGLASAGAQLWHLPRILSGPELAIFRGQSPDVHLLSAWIWSKASGVCGGFPWCVVGLNAAAFAALVSALSLAAWRVLERSYSPNGAMWGAALFGLLFGLSPLGAALIVEPLGAETTLSLVVFSVAVAEVAGVWSLPLVARCMLAAAIGLQEPLLAPAAIGYAVLAARPRTVLGMSLPMGCAIIALLAQIARAHSNGGAPPFWHVDASAGPPTIALIGVLLFFMAPAALFGLRFISRRQLGVQEERLLTPLVLGGLAIPAGMFSASGDPSAYLLCGGIALLFSMLAWTQPILRQATAVAALSMLVLFEAGAFVAFHQSSPSMVIASRSMYVQDAAVADASKGRTTCVVADAFARRYVLVNDLALGSAVRVGALFQCPMQVADHQRLIVLKGLDLIDWGVSGLNLARAAATAVPPAYIFPYADGIVSPKTPAHTPTGLGAFAQRLPSAVRRVKSFTVLAQFAYTFRCVGATAGEHLSFAVGQMPGAPTAHYEVSMRDDANRDVLATGTLERYRATDEVWHYVSVPIRRTSACAVFRFAAPSPVRYRSVWVTFVGAAIVPTVK